jgi:hypothetical protein
MLAASNVYAQSATGAVAGSFRATESGAAEYRIPIAAPPGVAGMEPKLALVYNSQSGNGLAGLGWNLEGLSAITRCPQTPAQDGGARGGVRLNWDDRYCLDGQRLMLVSGASYGADGAEYRTERESFTKILSYQTAGNGPAWFKAWTKSGQIIEYGNTADSRIEAQGSATVRAWAVNKISDTKGNYLTVSYYENPDSGEFVPTSLAVFRNDGVNPVGVSLEYLPRESEDITFGYVAGSIVYSYHLLKSIKTYSVGRLVHDYRLAHRLSWTSRRSILTSITQCDGLGNCLAPTTVNTYDPDLFAYNFWGTGSGYQNAHAGGQDNNLVGDFDGDGISDIAAYTGANGTWHVCYGLAAGGFDCRMQNAPASTPRSTVAADFDGDGRTDLAAYTGSNLVWHVCFGRGRDSNFECQYLTAHGGGFDNNAVGDFDGDGRSDLAGYTGSNSVWHVCFSNGPAGFDCRYLSAHGGGPTNNVVGDFDGDGRSDLTGYTGADNLWHVCNGRGRDANFECQYLYAHGGGSSNNVAADFNGDGKTDLAGYTGANNVWHVCLSTGNGFSCSYPTLHGGGVQNNAVGDFNGDGKSDLAAKTPSDSQWHVCLSTSGGVAGFRCGYVYAHGAAPPNNFVGDFNGDGKSDLIAYTGTYGVWHLTTSGASGAASDRVTSIDNGFGIATSITYKTLTDTSVYSKDTGASASSYPQADVQVAMPVVGAVSSSNGVGGSLNRHFLYGGLKVDHLGRGLLGFRWSHDYDDSAGVALQRVFRQDYPYTGLASSARKIVISSGATLGLTTTEFGTIGYGGTRFFPFPTSSIESGNDLNGAALPTVTTTTSFDSFGNAQSITVSSPGFSKTTTNTYTNDTTNWLLGRLTKSVVASTSDIPIPPSPPAGGGGSGGGSTPPPSNPIDVATLMVIVQMILED